MAQSTPATFCQLTDYSVSVKIVDIGANPIDGAPPYAPLLDSGRAEIVGFEPNPTALARLEAAKSQYETYLPHAIGDGRRHTLNVCAAPGMTSLLKPNRSVLELFHGFPSWGRVIETTEIDTVRLDDVPSTKGLDLLKIDIQGGELMAFQNATVYRMLSSCTRKLNFSSFMRTSLYSATLSVSFANKASFCTASIQPRSVGHCNP